MRQDAASDLLVVPRAHVADVIIRAVWLNAILPVLSLLLGAGLSYWAERRRYKTTREDSATDALRSQRGAAYRQFISDAHGAAHLLGRAAAGSTVPLVDDKVGALARVDSDVARDLYELEIFAGEDVLDAAREVRARLIQFREVIMDGALYYDETYLASLRKYQAARSAFLTAARAELVDSSMTRVPQA